MDNQGRVGGMNDLNGPEQWFRSLPIVTRTWFATCLILTCAGNFGMISIMSLVYNWNLITTKFEIWRFITCFGFVGKFDLSTVFGLYMLVQFSKQYENGPYNLGGGGGTADYAFALLFGMVMMLLSYPFIASSVAPIFVRNLTFYVLYIWSKRYPDLDANIWGFPIKALWLPFAYLALTVLLGNPFWDVVHGIAVGHLFYYLVDVVPLVYGKEVLHTPRFLIDYFGTGHYVPTPTAPPQQQANRGGFPAPGRVNPPPNPYRDNSNAGGNTGFGNAAARGGSARGNTGYNWGGTGRTLNG